MTFPSGKSRKIVVDGLTYAWVVSPDSGYIWILVKRDGNIGGMMRGLCTYEGEITPRRVADLIRQSLKHGWDPEKDKGVWDARRHSSSSSTC